MILWNIFTLVLVVLVIIEAARNNWGLPKLGGWATVFVLWLVTSLILYGLK